jgi:ComF family protein
LAPLLARYLVAVFAQPPWSMLPQAVTAVVPVPLHEQRLAERGYNQSELLAEHFCRAVELPLQPSWLQRVRETRQQVGLGPNERRANVEGAFVATSNVAGQNLLLVDDVYTTGATLRACAKAAQMAGARSIYGLTLAQPVRRAPNMGESEPDNDPQELPPIEAWWESEL